MNRRSFLRCSAGYGLSWVAVWAQGGERLSFPTASRDRIAVSSWPFRNQLHLKTGTIRLQNFPAMVVTRFGVKGVEPLSNHFAETTPEYLHQFNEALAKVGAHIVNIPVSPGGSLYDPNESKRRTVVETAQHWIDVAAIVRSPSIRVSVQGLPNVAPDAARTALSLEAITAYAQQKNILVNLENDDPRSEDAFFLIDVMKRVNSPNLHALPDFCNSMIEKHGDEAFNDAALKAMFTRAYNICHMKDSELDGQKLYRVNVERCFAIAKVAGYRGYYSMEWEGAGEPYGGTQKLIDLTMKYIRV